MLKYFIIILNIDIAHRACNILHKKVVLQYLVFSRLPSAGERQQMEDEPRTAVRRIAKAFNNDQHCVHNAAPIMPLFEH